MSSSLQRSRTRRLSAAKTVPRRSEHAHLQFRRYAGCPICNLHLRSVAARHNEIAAAGVREVAVFHSSVAAMLPYQGDLPFDVVADPRRRLYAQFGVEASVRALLAPRAIWAMLQGMVRRLPGLPARGETIRGLPADFLIAPDGVVLARKYGSHAYDQWSVDDLLQLARQHHPGSQGARQG